MSEGSHVEIIKGLKMGSSSRDIYVYLPSGDNLPLIVIHDGQFVFDVYTFGKHPGIDIALDMMIEEGTIPPAVVVGIQSTHSRLTTLSPWEGKDYTQFIQNTIIPFMENHYPIRRPYINIGFSAGGQMALYLTLTMGIFDKAGALIPLWTDHSNIKPLYTDKEIYCITQDETTLNILKQYIPSSGSICEIDPSAAHHPAYFRKMLPHMIEVLLKDEKT